MPVNTENGPRIRLTRLLLAIIERPNAYTKADLARKYDCSSDTIKGDLEILKAAGLTCEPDARYRYSIKEEKPLAKLKNLLHFSEEDQMLLYQAIDSLPGSTEKHKRLKRKLASLYDYKRLGHTYLRKPYLTKVDTLMAAKEEKKVVTLVDYRSSNSNITKDRTVEPFHISPPEDTLQAFDIERGELRHFRLSRIKRVEKTASNWTHEGHHVIMRTDAFRIVDNNQVMVHLRMKVGGFNEMTERWPMTAGSFQEAGEEGVYDFQCMVNHQFLGLANFILGFHHQLIEIIEPDSLIDHLQKQIDKMEF